MRVIDLPISLEGRNCIVCEAQGRPATAHFCDREGGPVCEEHFIDLLGLEKRLAEHGYEESFGVPCRSERAEQ